jgi:hypothetical protein
MRDGIVEVLQVASTRYSCYSCHGTAINAAPAGQCATRMRRGATGVPAPAEIRRMAFTSVADESRARSKRKAIGGLGKTCRRILTQVNTHLRGFNSAPKCSETSAQLQETIVTESHLGWKGHVRWLALLKSHPGDTLMARGARTLPFSPMKTLRYSF